MKLLKPLFIALMLIALSASVTGCLAAYVGAGAAGGYLLGHNYSIERN